MDKYLLQLLGEKGSIIIPNIGALMRNGDNSPIIFNPHLKFNNGALENFICISEGISEQEAANMVSKYARNIQQTVDKGEEYLMYGLGSFSKDDSGTIAFVESNGDEKEEAEAIDTKSKPEAPKEDTQKEEDKKPQTKEEKTKQDKTKETSEVKPKTEVKKEEKPETTEDKATVTQDKVTSPVKETNKEKEQKPSKAAENKKEVAPKKVEKKQTAQKPVAEKKEKAALKPKEQKQKKKNPVPLIILILILAGAGAFVGFKFDLVKSWVVNEPVKTGIDRSTQPTDTTVTETQEDVAMMEGGDTSLIEQEEEASMEAAEKGEVIAEEPETSISDAPSISSEANYTIVLNVFANPSNADKYYGPLSNQSQITLNKRGTKTWVFYGSYSTRKAANNDLQKAKNINPDAWIKKL